MSPFPRKPYIAGNWKMNLDRMGALDLVKTIKSRLGDGDDRGVAVFPSFVYIADVVAVAQGSPLGVGAQNVHYEESGAFTGEVSAKMLKDVGATRALVGHSERRNIFKEPDSVMGKKVRACLDFDLMPVYCLGETLEQRKNGKTKQVVEKQLKDGLEGVEPQKLHLVTIAYEPVWAIGTGVNATPEQAQEVHSFIRERLTEMFGKEYAEQVRIIYGGSVKPDNVKALMKGPDVDGVLVGGASLKPDLFLPIIEFDK